MSARTAPTNEGTPTVKSADRTLAILELLAEPRQTWTLGSLSEELGIPKSSLHSLLRTLEDRGWIEESNGGFRLGVRALLVGATYVDTDAQVLRAHTILDQLSDQTRETVHLGRLDGRDIVYLAKRESTHPLRLFSAIGRRLPAYATALGKAVLAALPPEAVAERLDGTLPGLTPNTITSLDELHSELEQTRLRGYAVDREENTRGICCFAVSIRTTVPPTDALSVSVPIARLDSTHQDEIVGKLLAAQEQMEN